MTLPPLSEPTKRSEETITLPVWLFRQYEEAYFALRHGLPHDTTPHPSTEPQRGNEPEVVGDEVLFQIRRELPVGARPMGILAKNEGNGSQKDAAD